MKEGIALTFGIATPVILFLCVYKVYLANYFKKDDN